MGPPSSTDAVCTNVYFVQELGTHMNKSMLEFPSELSRLLRQRLRALSCLTWVAEQGAAISFPALRCDHPADLQDPLPWYAPPAAGWARERGHVHPLCVSKLPQTEQHALQQQSII